MNEPGTIATGGSATPASGRATSLGRAVRAVSGVTLVSRFGGLIRDILIVRIFGSTPVGSAFAAAFQIPNTFRRLFGEGALSAAFIPAYTQAERVSKEHADRLASLTLAVLAWVTGGLSVLIGLGVGMVLWLSPADAERDLSLRLIIVIIPFMPLICIAAILAGMLQVHGRFGPASSGPVILNTLITLVGVVCLVMGWQGGAGVAYALCAATVLSGFTQVLWFRRLLRGHASWRRDWESARPDARAMLKKFVPVALGLGTLQVNTLLDTFIAMWPIWVGPTVAGFVYPLDGASNIILSQTTRLYQFPLGVFGIAVATAVFPMLARLAPEREAFVETLRRGLRLSLFIGLPASAGLVLVRHDLTGVLFARVGSSTAGFDADAVRRAALVLLGFAPGVWAYSLNHVLTRGFYAQGDTRTPMRVAMGAVGFNLALNVVLIWWLREAGLALATSVSAMAQTLVLAALLRRRLGLERLLDAATLRGMGRIAACTMGMGVVVGAWVWATSGGIPNLAGWWSGWWGMLARLAGATALGAGSFVALSRLGQLPELGMILGRRGRSTGAGIGGAADGG